MNQAAFPATVPEALVQIGIGSFFTPSTSFDGNELGFTRAEVRVRARIPRNDVVILQLMADFRASMYDVDDDGPLFAGCAECPLPDEFYSATLVAQGGYLLNRDWQLFRVEEQWVALGSLYGRARWEPGAFEESMTPGLALGSGYQLPGRFRIAAGARIEQALDGDGVRVRPWGDLSWDIAPKVQLKNRGLGLLLEYRLTRHLEVFATAFQSIDRFLMNDRPGSTSGTTFRDRQLLVGGGVVVKIARTFRLWGEAGAVVDRKISIDTREDRADRSANGDLSPYAAIRAEVRL